MFDFSVVHETVSSRQREAVRQVLDKALTLGTLTYTDVFMAPQPLLTMALEYLDGVSSASGMPQTVGSPKNIGPVRIVCLSPTDTIKISVWGSRNIYGTTVDAPPQKLPRDLGNVADVEDGFPDRYARNVIRAKGFPVRNVLSKGTNEGTVVEWKWLERRAKEADAPAEIVSIYNGLLERMTARDAPAPTKSKTAGPAPAHP